MSMFWTISEWGSYFCMILMYTTGSIVAMFYEFKKFKGTYNEELTLENSETHSNLADYS
jgi:hypothetical protein